MLFRSLADEINRASPKVQSALLECMAEHQITVGETTYPLEKLFFTIATQNPIEMEGTYPLPAAQLDRFFMKIRFGYVNEESELEIYRNYLQISQNLNEIQQVLTLQDMLQLQDAVSSVHLHEEIIRAVLHVVRATRHHEGISLGASTRSGIIYLKCLRAYALIRGRDYVLEDDLADLCMPVLDHRLLYKNKDAKSGALKQILNKEVERLSRLKLFS